MLNIHQVPVVLSFWHGCLKLGTIMAVGGIESRTLFLLLFPAAYCQPQSAGGLNWTMGNRLVAKFTLTFLPLI